MTLSQAEAEKLARDLMPRNAGIAVLVTSADLKRLCHAILSGDMKREIENAAYRRANSLVLKQCGTEGDHADNALCAASDAITSLITPAKTADTEG